MSAGVSAGRGAPGTSSRTSSPRPIGARVRLRTVSRFATALAVVVCAVAACGNGSASTTRWTALHPSPVTRSEVGAARIGRFVYVVGGFTNDAAHATTAAVERYDLDKDRWQRVHDMPAPLNHTAAAAYHG